MILSLIIGIGAAVSTKSVEDIPDIQKIEI
jgi:hypothetical protein